VHSDVVHIKGDVFSWQILFRTLHTSDQKILWAAVVQRCEELIARRELTGDFGDALEDQLGLALDGAKP
jgi:hypothetical protein